jgi:hypothetical protein
VYFVSVKIHRGEHRKYVKLSFKQIKQISKQMSLKMSERTFPLKTTIEIDCDPWTGMGRQQTHYEHICKNIVGCEPQPRISASFGCWEWPITYQTKEQQEKTAEFLKDLYNKGLCRYASW